VPPGRSSPRSPHRVRPERLPARAPLAEAVERVGDRWSLLIVDALLDGPLRFGDLEEAVAGVASNILSQRLKQLEKDGVVLARRYSDRPPRFAYELTGAGHELAGALRLLTAWGARRASAGGEETGGSPGQPGDPADGPRHDLCGTTLEARWYCPTCDVVIEDDPEASPGGGLHFV
jgi:DNA-binding HxlR family transcriptional regulator